MALGSGQPLADPFLAFLRRIFWENQPPNLQDGIFAATWALEHAIQTNPGGVDHPIQVMTLRGDAKACEVRELEETELGEHLEAIQVAERRLATFRQALNPEQGSTEEAAAAIPTP